MSKYYETEKDPILTYQARLTNSICFYNKMV